MKKLILISILAFWVSATSAADTPRLALHLGGGGLMAADEGYRGVYGDLVLLPRVKLGYRLTEAFGLWAGYAGLSKTGTGPVSGVSTESAQHYVSIGGSYKLPLTPQLNLTLAVGPLLAFYREAAGPQVEEGSVLGADLHAALGWSLSRAFSLELNLGYLLASAESAAGDSFKLGGLWGGVGLIIYF